MKSKRPYTQYRSEFQKAVKFYHTTPNELMGRVCTLMHIKEKEAGFYDGSAHCHRAACAVLIGDAEHIFMPDRPFCDWLVSCVPKFQPEHLAVLHQHLSIDAGEGARVGCLHFPCSSGLYSVAFVTNQQWKCATPVPDYGVLFTDHSIDEPEVSQVAVVSTHELPGNRAGYYIKLIIGLGMYLSCFPEAIRPGPPEDLKHPSHHKHKTVVTVGISDKVRESSPHGSPTAHFRRGHFRVLQAECFTKKRFQTIFVHEAFVKGHAKTIVPLEALENTPA